MKIRKITEIYVRRMARGGHMSRAGFGLAVPRSVREEIAQNLDNETIKVLLTERGEAVGIFPREDVGNLQRTQEGGKPTFLHKKFVQVGSI